MKGILTILTAVILLVSSFTFSSCKNYKNNPNNPTAYGDKDKDESKDNPDNPATDGDKKDAELTAEQLLAAEVKDNLNLAKKADKDYDVLKIARNTAKRVVEALEAGTRVGETVAADVAQIFREGALKAGDHLQQLKSDPPYATLEPMTAKGEAEMWAQAAHWGMMAGQKDKAREDAKSAREAAQETLDARVDLTVLAVDLTTALANGRKILAEHCRADAKEFAKTAYQETGLKWKDFQKSLKRHNVKKHSNCKH
jgi:hypothetical protein